MFDVNYTRSACRTYGCYFKCYKLMGWVVSPTTGLKNGRINCQVMHTLILTAWWYIFVWSMKAFMMPGWLWQKASSYKNASEKLRAIDALYMATCKELDKIVYITMSHFFLPFFPLTALVTWCSIKNGRSNCLVKHTES